ncbi:hypothetical protein CFBP4996_06680 [Agrobacterium leguminum]|uniref:Uncharacterized protein n=1 Tax=Agrobacterium deltaense NCPPB 1641 TaxID=1183425 RepID=A0A1S7TKF4_9HYPH|nr:MULTISPECIES: hypothetical protein [Agrobacterium]WFS66968.1 hypothetical protein CFBP4996_06680 [Agrobacterium leguminum]CVI55074.1 hypothetical protein AGR7A_Cc160045 [Agrobacterium deltaense NCPPB 1641]
MPSSPEVFEKYRSALLTKPLSAVWRGHGSAIFLEFGGLSPQEKRDGTAGNSHGDVTVMIEWSWRIESEDAIVCGSWSDEEGWEEIFQSLIGRDVQCAALFGRLPELSIALAGGLYVVSFMTAEGQPGWTIFDRCSAHQQSSWIEVRDGKVCETSKTKNAPATIDPAPKSLEA